MSCTKPSGVIRPRPKKYFLMPDTRRWYERTRATEPTDDIQETFQRLTALCSHRGGTAGTGACSQGYFSNAGLRSDLRVLPKRYSIISSGRGFANGPRRTHARNSGLRLLWVMVTMRFIKPLSTSSVMAASSLLCRRHHAVLSGMELGTTLPNAFSNLVLVCLPSPPRTRARFLKNSDLFIVLSA